MKWRTVRYFLLVLEILLISVFFVKKEEVNKSLLIPFDVARAGDKVSAEVIVSERQVYAIELQYFIKEKSRVDQDRVRQLVGASQQGEHGVWSESGAPLLFHVLVEKTVNGRGEIKVDRKISRPRLSSWGATSLNAQLLKVELDPGVYRVQVENMIDAPQLKIVETKLGIYRAYIGK